VRPAARCSRQKPSRPTPASARTSVEGFQSSPQFLSPDLRQVVCTWVQLSRDPRRVDKRQVVIAPQGGRIMSRPEGVPPAYRQFFFVNAGGPLRKAQGEGGQGGRGEKNRASLLCVERWRGRFCARRASLTS